MSGSLYQEWHSTIVALYHFRPKLSDTIGPGVLELRLQGGHKNYKRNVNELKIYEDKQNKKFQQLDHEIAQLIQGLLLKT